LKTRCWLLERFASVWPKLIITCGVRGVASGCTAAAGLRSLQALCLRIPITGTDRLRDRQTDRQTDITTGLHIASFAFKGGRYKMRTIFKILFIT